MKRGFSPEGADSSLVFRRIFRMVDDEDVGAASLLDSSLRWVIADLIGKRKRIRAVPIPAWAKAAIRPLD